MKNRIDTVVWDADNTLWDWIKMHLEGMRIMSKKISQIIGYNEDEVRRSMGRVYGQAGTFDYKPLVQEMDLVVDWAKEIPDDRERVRRLLDLGFAVHTAYTQRRSETFALYDGAEDVLSTLNENEVQNVVLSDAPISKIVRRLKRFGIDKQFSLVCGRPDAKVAEELKSGEDHLHHYEDTRKEFGVYTIDVPMEILTEEKKPDVDLAVLLKKSTDEVAETVAMVGDNFEKDMGMAHNNYCYGLYARYGAADSDAISGLHDFAPAGVVHRNAAGIDLSEKNRDIIRRMDDKLKIIDETRDVLKFVLGQK